MTSTFRRAAAGSANVTARIVRPRSFLGTVAPLALIAYLCWQGWDYIGPHKPQLGPDVREVADLVIPAVVEDLRNESHGLRSVVFLHLAGDSTDYVTNQIRQQIEAHNVLDLSDRTLPEKVIGALKMRNSGYSGIDTALAAGKKMDVQGVLFGTVRRLDSGGNGSARIDLDLSLADVSRGKVVFTRQYIKQIGEPVLPSVAGDKPPVAAAMPVLARAGDLLRRLIAWSVVVILLPVFTISFIRAMVRRESNQSNAFTLAVYTMVDALLAYLVLGISPSSPMSLLTLGLCIIGAVLYNIAVMSFAVRLET